MYSYEQERQRKAEERKNAPKQCPHCKAPINEHLSEWDKVKYHCGSDPCRAAASRAGRSMRERQRREQISANVEQYANQLDPLHRATVLGVKEYLTRNSRGYSLIWQLCHVIEARACKHDRIGVLEANAEAANRRADQAEAHNKELKAVYEARIAELEEEIKVYQALENVIHGIGTRQLERKAEQDPIELPEIDGEQEEDREEDEEEE